MTSVDQRLALLNEENDRLKGVLDSTIELIRREHAAKLSEIELQHAQRDAVLRDEVKRLLAERERTQTQLALLESERSAQRAALVERDAALAQLRSVKDEFGNYKADLALMGSENERLQKELRALKSQLKGSDGQLASVRDDQALQVQALRQSLRALHEQLSAVTLERDDAVQAKAALLLSTAHDPSPASQSDGALLAAELADLRQTDAALKAEVARLAARLADADDKVAAARAKADARIAAMQADADKRQSDADAAADALVRAASERAANASAREAAAVRQLGETRERWQAAESATAAALQQVAALEARVAELLRKLDDAAEAESKAKALAERLAAVADSHERAREAAELSAGHARVAAEKAAAAVDDAKAFADAALRDRDDAIARALAAAAALDVERARSNSFEAAANDAAVLKADRDLYAEAVRKAEQQCAQIEAERAAATDALAAMANQVEALTLRGTAVSPRPTVTPAAPAPRSASERAPATAARGGSSKASAARSTRDGGWFRK
jgi:trimeric autotransporter adhesin